MYYTELAQKVKIKPRSKLRNVEVISRTDEKNTFLSILNGFVICVMHMVYLPQKGILDWKATLRYFEN